MTGSRRIGHGVMSMTGFGRSRAELSERLAASVVIRGVNHRFLDVQVRINLREELPEVEAAVRAEVGRRLTRGRIQVQLNFERTALAPARVLVDGEAVASVLAQLRSIEGEGDSVLSVELRDVLAIPGLVAVSSEETSLGEEEIRIVRQAAARALDSLVEMRAAEGQQLSAQILAELDHLGGFLDWLEPQLDGVRQRLAEKLHQRLTELLDGDVADPARVVQEAAILADRADVAEEVVRLRSHVGAFAGKLDEGRAVGRTLDFLCQEIHRELNTIGSKCREVGLVERLVEAKGAVERIREQVQNVE